MNVEKSDLIGKLNTFTANDNLHSFPIKTESDLKYTDGVKYLCEQTNFFWFLDIISEHHKKIEFDMEFLQTWFVQKIDDYWLIVAKDSENEIMIEQKVFNVDFPFNYFEFHLGFGVLTLTSE